MATIPPCGRTQEWHKIHCIPCAFHTAAVKNERRKPVVNTNRREKNVMLGWDLERREKIYSKK